MSACIYLFHDRIIHWSPMGMFSKPVGFTKVRWYTINGTPPVPFPDMVLRENVGYNMQRGFYTVEGDPPEEWEDRKHYVKAIQLLGSFQTIANNQKSLYTDNSIGQALTEALIVDEIREYRRTKNLDGCTILTSLLETTEAGLTPDALATKLWLRYESYRSVIAYLNHLEFNVRQCLKDREYEKATELINKELERMRV